MPRTQFVPPIHPNQITPQEMSLIRQSTEEKLTQEIRMYLTQDRHIGWGYDHHWGLKQVDYGKVNWHDVGRPYRICYNVEHHQPESRCTRHWLGPHISGNRLNALESLRAIFDMTGEPWCPGTLAHESVRNEALWDQLEYTTIPALKGIFERLLPYTEYTDDDYSIYESDDSDLDVDDDMRENELNDGQEIVGMYEGSVDVNQEQEIPQVVHIIVLSPEQVPADTPVVDLTHD
ncbi:hypothetical protein VKT23_014155 [Stygiomarasmius scandens]|uniref:Uncharacterized protein n=1 Tax=Marasmiellus scandens TaxID=2682957 RepID=A0ABR1J643_9AGAR